MFFDRSFQTNLLMLLGKGNSKLIEIQNSPGYVREFTYGGTTTNVTQIKHYCADTRKGSVIENIEYENPLVDGSRVTKITIQ
ncbi:MAG: hypothetical protein RIR01_2355 [Bacteroidota bacterium]|jgi:hypothetical protein